MLLFQNKANSEEEAIWPNEEEEKDAIVHEGYIFTPQSEHLGYMVRLRVLPYDSEGRPGQPLGNPVPPLLPSENRHKANIPRTLPFLGQLTTAPRPIEMAPAQKLIKKRSVTSCLSTLNLEQELFLVTSLFKAEFV